MQVGYPTFAGQIAADEPRHNRGRGGSKMILKRTVLLAVTGLLAISPAQAQSTSISDAFQEWLTAINSGEKAAIQAWYSKRLGFPNAAFPLDMAEDTCGFDVVRVESETAQTLSALVAERCYPSLERVRIEAGAAGDEKLKNLTVEPFALTQERVSGAIAGMADRLSKDDKFAGSLLIVHGGERPLARSWGLLDKPGSASISLDTPMFLASAGKMFTAVSVLQLVGAGRIDLDAPLGRYLPDYPNSEAAKVTIRQLLQHQDGLGDIGILRRDEAANRARVRTIDDILKLNGNRAPAFEPGTKTEYSNYGYVLLGAVVQRVSGQSYYDYVADHIFVPAGMSHAGFPDLEHLAGVAAGYTTFYGEEPRLMPNREILPWRGTPAGGGVASANDLAKFFGSLRSGKLLPPAMLKLATTGDDSGWGMGFLVNPGPSKRRSYGHGGGSYGMDVAAHYYPGIDTTFICTASRDSVCNRLITEWFFRIFGLEE
jgi:CubicO group peptidase (beta-lactamase class C family)